ncbi:multi-sensor hybrid histidine kinase [Solidesulfovibrio fructosivorans JJ]]|uniref:Sensory/regulatory protein RpfC n=1 Tax=Solidesulfovibrio fructosivorans JJ] TaxID=596151 RepID=E1JWI5_SOLFR|nr:PAS domain S-box protein [Solidesulfovibrio fructosivorans]EFL51282.1 multi-sensor hybrid histidine kinase [Solidesulfovibrio fructosivorans JJ]]
MPWMRMHSLRTRLFWLVLLALLPAIVLHVASTLEKRNTARQAAKKNLTTTAELAAANLHSVLKNAGEILQGVSALPEITAMRPIPAERLLIRVKEFFSDFATISLLSPGGTIVASNLPTGREINYGDRPWVRQALAGQALAIGGFTAGKRTGLPGLALACPVRDPAGTIIGVCTLNLRLSWFSGVFSDKAMPPEATACLLDGQGNVLAAWPEASRPIGRPLPDAATIMTEHGHAPKAIRTGPGPDGAASFEAIVPVMANGRDALYLQLGLPVRSVGASLERTMFRDLGFLVVTLAFALLAALVFSNTTLLRPTRQLVRTATAMARGNLSSRLDIGPGYGELSELGRALDVMAASLRERIRFTQELIDAIPAPVFYKSLDGRYLGCNKTYETMVHPLASILGKTSRAVQAPEIARQCEDTDREALTEPQRSIQFEMRARLRDGAWHDQLVTKSSFENASGVTAGIIGVMQDITTLRHSEMALSDSEAKYRTLLASMRDGFVVIGKDNRIMESNPAFREMLGYSREELNGLTTLDITPERWQAPEEAVLRTAVDTQGFSGIFEKEYRRKDGSVFPAALRLQRYPSRGDDARRYFAIVRDVTEDKAIEADLRAAKEAAETANRAKSDFLAKMSHDIRTPLNAVIGMTELTLDTPLSHQQRDALETARESAASLLALINDILDISRIEARKLELASDVFDLRRTLAGITRSMRAQAKDKGLRLALAIAPRTPRFVTGDPVRLRQILLNLVGNGIKFTDQGSVSLIVGPDTGQAKPDGATAIAFTVSDTGIGIESERLEGIFDMFAQADASITRQYGGTGLGLAICRELARLMGGCIVAESRPGAGSRFRVVVPLPPALPPETAATPGANALTAPATILAAPRSLRILLVEDNPVNVKVARTYLSRRGHAFLVAENGNKALAILQTAPVDVVLMDVEMPGMDGLEATRRLRTGQAGPVNRNVPVVAMTAHALSGARQRCLEAGMNDYLAKPLDFHALDALLDRISRQAATSDVNPPPTDDAPPALDRQQALSRLDGDLELLQELQRDFLRQYPRKLRLIDLCLDKENWDEAALAAHSLKNIAGAVGAEASRQAAGRLETHLRQADYEAASDALAAIKALLGQAAKALQAEGDGEEAGGKPS